MASIEGISVLVIFLVLMAFMLGAFGIVNTGIQHSLAARTYAFEIFRHRANLVYLRENLGSNSPPFSYNVDGVRVHGIMPENWQTNSDGNFQATSRAISMAMTTEVTGNQETVHNINIPTQVKEDQRITNEALGVSPAWVMVQYGICVNASCGE